MSDRLDAQLGRVMAAWVGGVDRRPWTAIAGTLLLALAGGWYAAEHLGIQGDTESLFSKHLPFKLAEKRFYRSFPSQFETMFIVIDAVTPERAGEAAEALAERLRAQPEDFSMVFLPGGGEFFERNAFLYLDTAELEDLADRLAEAQPYLAELSRDGSLRGLASILARGARAVRDGDVAPERLSAIYQRTAEALDARVEGDAYHLSWAEVLAAREFEGDPRRRVMLVQPVLHVEEIQPAKRAIEAVRRSVQELDLDPEQGVRVRITGDVALSYEEIEVVKRQAATAGLASFLLVGVILGAALRSARLVLSTLFSLVVGLVLTAAFTAVAIGHFNMISAAFAVLFIGLGVDFGIHVCTRYRELLGEGNEHREALRETARMVGSSLALCAITTAIGFFAFVPTEFVGVAELGLISGAGMLISLFVMVTLLPALLSVLPTPSTGRPVRGTSWGGDLIELTVRYPRVVRWTALVLGLSAALLLPRARFDNNPINVRDPSSESVKTFVELLEKGTSSPWSLNLLTDDPERARELAARLRELPHVDRVVTLADFVPDDQEEKLDIIEEVALFLGPVATPGGEMARPSAAENIESLRHLERELSRLPVEELPEEFGAAAAQLRESLERYLPRAESGESEASLAALESSLLGTLDEQLRVLNAALGARRVTLENLPDALVDQMVGHDGKVRVQVFPTADLTDHAALEAFVDAVRAIDPRASGSASEIIGAGRTVVAALQQALLSAFVAVTLLVLALWRRVTDTALVLIPLALATSFTVATAVLLEIPFNYADVIVLPLLLGIGVDSGIHLVHRARLSGDASINLLSTSTARAVAYSALTTIASFGTMGLAPHRGLATLGQLLTIGVGFTLVCNLVVLPSLIALRWRSERVAGAPHTRADLSHSARRR
jgi:hopanoid biosynthesis associated RND transporter like protein HpnN